LVFVILFLSTEVKIGKHKGYYRIGELPSIATAYPLRPGIQSNVEVRG